MFKKIAVMIFTLSMLAVGSCFAAMVGNVPDSEASLGGITLGNKMSYVRSIYGEPTEQHRTKTIEEIVTTANNGISTPRGVTVGIPKATVDALYGEGYLWNGVYRYLTDQGKRIEIQYVPDAKGITIVKAIRISYPA